ncbi:hypothetical protein [Thiovibrio frasassiensis]|uniref:Uncharacterized protein n=1 Tax=Thiovibrio frasassiensis TaxID=2984131 RepID=A0A9X4MJ74_9BACT|nr:hypothetical protein [Thiovibrio frasassiensis]MDG4476980.1 hypothetical protein [Thiovibrio frasassiensis]
MRLSERRKEGAFYFAVQHTAGEVAGGEVEIAVFAAVPEGEGVLLLLRSLYFDEQSLGHIDNFCKEFAYDPHYRKLCLYGAAHWCRVARLYEANARILQDEQPVGPAALEKNCRELFHLLRRDLVRIESRPEYQAEMARVNRGAEEALQEALGLLARIKGLKVVSACQGSGMLQFGERRLYLPSCHGPKASIVMEHFPHSLKNHLQSGPLGQQHLALFEENRLSADHPAHNPRFIRLLTASLHPFLQKHPHT